MTVLTKRICPICHSDRINLWMGGYTGAMYRCPDCGYVGSITIETSDDVPRDEIREDEKG